METQSFFRQSIHSPNAKTLPENHGFQAAFVYTLFFGFGFGFIQNFHFGLCGDLVGLLVDVPLLSNRQQVIDHIVQHQPRREEEEHK